MNVNLHYESQVWILGLGRIFNSMPAEFAKNILETKLREFGVLLNNDIVALVTDGASVMIKMGKLSKPLHFTKYDSNNNYNIELPASSSEIMPNPPDDSELGGESGDIFDDMLDDNEICDPNDTDVIIPILKHHLNLVISRVRRITKMLESLQQKRIYCKTTLKKFEMERN